MSLLVGGKLIEIDGLVTLPPASHGGPAWAKLSARDYKARKVERPQIILGHTTKGKHPQHVILGAGAGGKDRIVADFWNQDPEHSAAQVVIDTDGSVVGLCDLERIAAYHAGDHVVNDLSLGVELYQMNDGGIYEATLTGWVRFVEAMCYGKGCRYTLDAINGELRGKPWPGFGIPFSVPSRAYANAPSKRFAGNLGDDVRGVLGHRDVSSNRGRGDPGDMAYQLLVDAGAERVDFETREDLTIARQRQQWLNYYGARVGSFEPLIVDGLFGLKSKIAMWRMGFTRWSDVPRRFEVA